MNRISYDRDKLLLYNNFKYTPGRKTRKVLFMYRLWKPYAERKKQIISGLHVYGADLPTDGNSGKMLKLAVINVNRLGKKFTLVKNHH